MLFTGQIRKRQSLLEEYQAPLSDALWATAEEAVIRSPTESGSRARELFEAEHGETNSLWGILTGGSLALDPDTPVIAADEARARVQEEGLDLSIPDEGIREGALNILIDRKKQERKREDILNRAPGGLVPASAKIATSLAASMMDPLNIGAAFIPVVGPARYSAMLARAGTTTGRAAVRARVGLAEGAAGATLVEPLVYSAAQYEQANYDTIDSLLNIGLGTALGGGLHVGAGAVADAVSKGLSWRQAKPVDPLPRAIDEMPLEAREAALRTAVAQAASGREIDVAGILDIGQIDARATGRLEPVIEARAGQPEPMDTALSQEARPGPVSRGDPEFERAAAAQERRVLSRELPLGRKPRQPVSLTRFVAGMGGVSDFKGEVRALDLHRVTVPGVGKLVRENGKSLDRVREAAAEAGYFNHVFGNPDRAVAESTVADFLDLLEQDARGNRVFSGEDADQVARVEAFAAREEERAEMRARLDQIVAEADAVLPDDIAVRASDLMAVDELDADVALERAILEDYFRDGDAPVPLERTDGSEIPFFDDDGGPSAQREEIEAGGPFGLGTAARGQDRRTSGTTREDQTALAEQIKSLNATARASFQPENLRLTDFEASRSADEQLKIAPQDETMPEVTLEEAMESVQETAAALGMDDVVSRELADLDALAETAESYGRAVRAATDCGLRRGTV